MKKAFLVSLVVLFSAISFAQNKYVGVNSCVCHNLPKQGKQMEVWKNSKHAQAFEVLKSEQATKYATAKEIKGSPTEAKECLECHTTGYGQPAEKSFDMTKGVQCEECHGAASGYKAIHNKPENKEKAVAAGLMLHKDDAKFCQGCHVSKMHDVKAFDYKKMWEQIKHPLPAAKG
ncbi:MAG: cytochrome c family protein [Bacteroidota bacterium]|nr:cytochrome c family protein [Bacteroidota bacterium]